MDAGWQDYVCSADRRHTDEYDAACDGLYAAFHAAHPDTEDPAWDAFRAADTIGPREVHLGFDAQRSVIYGCAKCKARMAWVKR